MTHDPLPVKMVHGERMKREGRWNKFQAARRVHRDKSGDTYSAAQWVVMKDFGYENRDVELDLHREWVKAEAAKEQCSQDAVEEMRQEEDHQSDLFLAAFEKLPDYLPDDRIREEMGWVLSHPAMLRSGRDQEKVVRLTVEDIEGAPSKAAVSTLQANVNAPRPFFDKYRDGKLKGFDKPVMQASDNSSIEATLDPDNMDDQSTPDAILRQLGETFKPA